MGFMVRGVVGTGAAEERGGGFQVPMASVSIEKKSADV